MFLYLVLREGVTSKADTIIELLKSGNKYGKVQTLQWAISNAAMGNFNYYFQNANGSTSAQKESKDAVIGILASFMEGNGSYLSIGFFDENSQRTEEDLSAFRTKLASQILRLTGQQPRLEKMADGLLNLLHMCTTGCCIEYRM